MTCTHNGKRQIRFGLTSWKNVKSRYPRMILDLRVAQCVADFVVNASVSLNGRYPNHYRQDGHVQSVEGR